MRNLLMKGVTAAAFVTGLTLTPGDARGQGFQPVVLQHGFMSNAGTWDTFAPWLERHAYVQTSRFSTGSNSLFSRQANKLRASVAHLPDTTIFIGHSNGGIIVRHLSHMRPMKGYITVGTPQRGAPLAAAVLNGTADMFAQMLSFTAAEAGNAYDRAEFQHPSDWMRHVGVTAASGQEWLGRTIGGLVSIANFVDDVGETVLTDMNPTSYFFSPWSGLNSPDALRAEARFGARRVAIASHVVGGYFPEWMIWKGLRPGQSAELSLMTDAVLVTLLLTYDHYASYYEPEDWYSAEKQANAYLWAWAAGALAGMDMSWCTLIGAGRFVGCEPADGIVPVSYQTHPDPAVDLVIIRGPAHQEQTSSVAFREVALEQLRNRFGVTLPPVPPVHPLTVTIDGSSGTTVGWHTNTAYPVAGTGSYAYRWYVSGDGNYFEDTGVTTASYSLRLDVGQMYWIRVVVTSGSEQATDTRMLGPVCVDQCY